MLNNLLFYLWRRSATGKGR